MDGIPGIVVPIAIHNVLKSAAVVKLQCLRCTKDHGYVPFADQLRTDLIRAIDGYRLVHRQNFDGHSIPLCPFCGKQYPISIESTFRHLYLDSQNILLSGKCIRCERVIERYRPTWDDMHYVLANLRYFG